MARMTPDKIKERRNRKDVDDILKRLYRKACEYLNHKKQHYSKMTRDLFFTLCETCKNLGVNYKEYVAYAAKELIGGNTDYEALAPWAIKLV